MSFDKRKANNALHLEKGNGVKKCERRLASNVEFSY